MQPPQALSFPPIISEIPGKDRVYGALMDHQLAFGAAAARDLKRKNRRRLNSAAVLQAFFIPWGAFLITFSVVSFYLHYMAPLWTSLFVVVAFGICISALVGAIRDRSKPVEDRFYPAYMAGALAAAVFFGCALGDLNFWSVMHPSYEAEHLATYSNVDPSSEKLRFGEDAPTRGRRFQDAGTIYFRSEAVVDVNRSASFKMGDLYCVAPIVNPACKGSCGVDFWAVGTNCCLERGGGFQCGASSNPHAKSGVRMLAASKRSLYRLAVLQAEGLHKLTSVHPLFFWWVQDPVAEVMAWKKSGYRRFIVAMFISFFTGALTLAAALKSASKL